ncbi:MAG: AmmeMemoRadiSam system radical SAM enzyme [Candidatus Micrarchaeota archaeon]
MPKTKALFEKIDSEKIRCLACCRYCQIPEGQSGFCGVRVNEKGKLKLTVYARPCAVYVDPVEKKPVFHFLPGSKSYSLGTFGCNFSCSHCQNFDISQAPWDLRKKDPINWRKYFDQLVAKCPEMKPEKLVEEAIKNKCKSIAFTYNEPTIFTEYAVDIMKLAKKKGLKGIYVTNGYESKECWGHIKSYIDVARIDLKAFTQEFYKEICGATLEPVKESILYARKLGMWVEIITLLIPGENDSDEELKKMAGWLASIDKEMPWHVTAFYPAYKMLDKPSTPPETLIRAREIGLNAGLKYVYVGNLPPAYANYECTNCPNCKRKIIDRIRMETIENNILNGKCRFCNTKIKGVW